MIYSFSGGEKYPHQMAYFLEPKPLLHKYLFLGIPLFVCGLSQELKQTYSRWEELEVIKNTDVP